MEYEAIFSASRLGGRRFHRWLGGCEPLDVATKALGHAVVDSGAPVFSSGDKLVTYTSAGGAGRAANDELVILEAAGLKKLITEFVATRRVTKRNSGGFVKIEVTTISFLFPNVEDHTREPNAAVLQELLEVVLPRLAIPLE